MSSRSSWLVVTPINLHMACDRDRHHRRLVSILLVFFVETLYVCNKVCDTGLYTLTYHIYIYIYMCVCVCVCVIGSLSTHMRCIWICL
jgi:hypothetical protein